MQVILLKKYKPHTRELKIGTEMGVTKAEGERLINKGIARDVTKEYEKNLQKKRDEDSNIEENISKPNEKQKK